MYGDHLKVIHRLSTSYPQTYPQALITITIKKQHDVLQYFLNRLYCSRSTHLILTMRGQFMSKAYLLNALQNLVTQVREDIPPEFMTKHFLFALEDAEHLLDLEKNPQTYDEDLDDLSKIPFGR